MNEINLGLKSLTFITFGTQIKNNSINIFTSVISASDTSDDDRQVTIDAACVHDTQLKYVLLYTSHTHTL